MKVFGGYTFKNGKQVRTIVATKTKKKARELLGVSDSEFRNYWCETGNAKELEAALSQPETVLISEKEFSDIFKNA